MRRPLALLLLACAASAHAQGFAWPEGRKAAVSLAYDDALPSQLDIAVPALKRHGLKASFYLTLSNETVAKRLDEWRAVAADGNELGNHTLFHPCSASKEGREWVVPYRDLDTMTAPQMHEEVRLANAMLHAIDGRERRTFTPPCGDRLAGGEDYVAGVTGLFDGLRVPGDAVAPDMSTLDPNAITATAPVGLTGAQLIALVEDAARKGTMVSLTFHGVGGDYLTTSAQAHAQLLDYLAAHRDTYWVATFDDIATYIRSRREPK